MRIVETPAQYLANTVEDTRRTRDVIPHALDLAYGPDPLQTLDVYYPKGAKGLPVVMDVHGGGWQRGSKNSRGFPAAALCMKGAIWAPIDYRLSPMANLAEMVTDIRAALTWIHQHIAEYGGDPNKITVTGHSAGAQLAAMVLLDGWQGHYGVPTDVIKGGCLISGVYDVHRMAGGLGVSHDEALRYVPHRHPPKDGPPVIVAWGSQEQMEVKLQSRRLAQIWGDEAGIDMTEIETPGDHHFSIGRTLVEPGTPLNRAFLDLIGLD